MSTEVVLWFFGVITEACLIGLLFHKRVQRRLPMFLAYCIWDVTSNLTVYLLFGRVTHETYAKVYLAQTAIDSVLVFCVLVEIVYSVLQPLGASLARRMATIAGAALMAVVGIAWWLASVPGAAEQGRQVKWILELQQATSLTRILFFLTLAGSSRLLSLGLRDRELQVTTGFGIYSLVSMGIELTKSHPGLGLSFRLLNQVAVATFDAMLLYWLIAFLRKEEARKPITPQMQSFLLNVAGKAHQTREKLAHRAGSEPKD